MGVHADFFLQENTYVQTWWLTGKEGYNFTLKLDVCVFVPKKVKLDRVVVKRERKPSSVSLVKKNKPEQDESKANGNVAKETIGESNA